MPNRILERILRNTSGKDLLEALTEQLGPTDLQSLLLEVYRIRAKRLTPAGVLERYRTNRFIPPARVPPLDQTAFDRTAYSLLPAGFEALELSPVCPLGTVSALGPVDQNNILTTIRNTEVTSDSTNVLALECALRRRRALADEPRSRESIRLCASHRLLRTQAFDEPAAFPHFRILSLCAAGRDRGDFGFEREMLIEQAEYYARLLVGGKELGLRIRDPRLTLIPLDPDAGERLSGDLSAVLGRQSLPIRLKTAPPPEDAGSYYRTARFQILARDPKGRNLLLVDGGFTDWTQKLLGSRKERLLISGLGSERLLAAFRA